MQPEPLMLKEFAVIGKFITVEEIFEERRAKLTAKLSRGRILMECFYREIKQEQVAGLASGRIKDSTISAKARIEAGYLL